MKNRGIAAVVLLPLVTFGIYGWYWFVKTKGELNSRGAAIPTAWIWVIPFGSIYWMWKYFEAAEKETNGKVSAILNFVLSYVGLGMVSMAISQSAYNELGSQQSAQPQQATNPPEQPPVQTVQQ